MFSEGIRENRETVLSGVTSVSREGCNILRDIFEHLGEVQVRGGLYSLVQLMCSGLRSPWDRHCGANL